MELIEKNVGSFPPLMDQVTVSLAVKVWTVVVFSLIVFRLVSAPALPEGPVINGAVVSSLTSAMVTSIHWLEEFPERSVAFTYIE